MSSKSTLLRKKKFYRTKQTMQVILDHIHLFHSFAEHIIIVSLNLEI